MNKKLLLLLVGSAALASCARGCRGPSDTVKEFLAAGEAGEGGRALEYLQASDREFLSKRVTSQKEFMPPEGMSYRLGKEDISGDTATVVVVSDRDGVESSSTMKLLRENGEWKIDLVPDDVLEMLRQVDALKGAQPRGPTSPTKKDP